MDVLITGGTGTISSGLVKECVNRGYNTVALTRGNAKYRNIEGAEYIYVDINDEKRLEHELGERQFDIVVECLVYSVEELKYSIKIFGNRCKKYFFISTNGIYQRNDYIYDEDYSDIEKSELDWWYTKEKLACEQYLKTNTNINYTIIRPVVTFGDYRIPFPIATRKPTWTLINRVKQRKPILSCKNARFSVLHIDDFARIVVSLFLIEEVNNNDFHISVNESEVWWDDVIKMIGDYFGIKPDIIHIPNYIFKETYKSVYEEIACNKSLDLVVGDTKLRKVLPSAIQNVPIKEGIIRMIIASENEFESNHLELDSDWEKSCDRTLAYAYCMRALNEYEFKIVEEYLYKMTREENKMIVSILQRYKCICADLNLVCLSNSVLEQLDSKYYANLFNGKKIYVWGTGNTAKQLLKNLPDVNLEGFVESTKTKENLCIGEKVYTIFDDIKDLVEDAFIIVASIYYNEIKCKLEQWGKIEDVDFVHFKKVYSTPRVQIREELLRE